MNALLRESRVSDARLLETVARGDLRGLGELFERYEPDVRGFIQRRGVRPVEVDDLIQLTFLDVVRAAATFDRRNTNARGWLLGVAAIVVRRHRRCVARIARTLVAWAREPVRHDASAIERFELRRDAERARSALTQLSAKKRDVFALVVMEDVSGQEAAQTLRIPIATVWTRLYHARHELREYLDAGDLPRRPRLQQPSH